MKRIKNGVVILSSLVFSILFGVGLLLVQNNINDDVEPVSYFKDAVKNFEIPVNNTQKVMINPYLNEDVQIISGYYDINGSEEDQTKSIILFNDIYMQNRGIIYGLDNVFDVVAIYDGEVIRVDDADFLGKVVEIRHSNNIVSVYQLLSDVNVEVGTNIKQGDKIGVSSLSNITNDNKYKMYFELIIDGELVNPLNYYGKEI